MVQCADPDAFRPPKKGKMNPWRVIVEDHSQTCGVETLDQLNCSPARCNQIARMNCPPLAEQPIEKKEETKNFLPSSASPRELGCQLIDHLPAYWHPLRSSRPGKARLQESH